MQLNPSREDVRELVKRIHELNFKMDMHFDRLKKNRSMSTKAKELSMRRRSKELGAELVAWAKEHGFQFVPPGVADRIEEALRIPLQDRGNYAEQFGDAFPLVANQFKRETVH